MVLSLSGGGLGFLSVSSTGSFSLEHVIPRYVVAEIDLSVSSTGSFSLERDSELLGRAKINLSVSSTGSFSLELVEVEDPEAAVCHFQYPRLDRFLWNLQIARIKELGL